MQKIKFCFTSEKAKELYNGKPPQFETPFASGFDLRSIKDIVLFAGNRTLIKTGIRIELPLQNKDGEILLLWGIDIRSRSGLASKHGLRVFQGVGTVDNDYRGELCVIFENVGHEPYEIKLGDKIAQGVFNPLKQVDFQEISQEEFEATCCDTKRGSSGFGSTGK